MKVALGMARSRVEQKDGSNMTTAAKNEMKSNLLFMSKFFRHGITIASIWPSSRALSRATVREVDWSQAATIVELGAGTGPITEEIVKRLQPHTRFISIERDEDFFKILQQRFSNRPNVEIVHADVRNIDTILRERGIEKVDYFISGLATPTLPPNVRRRLLVSIRRYLSPRGCFSNITEFPLIYLGYYKNLFKHVHFQFVPANMPPGGVYHCRGWKV